MSPQPQPQPQPLSFAQLAKLEPQLAKLLRQAQSLAAKVPEDQSFCGKTLWDGNGCGGWGSAWAYKLDEFVGPKRKEGPAELQTWWAHEIAVDKIYYALPACQGYCIEDGHDSQVLGFREETWIWPQPGAWVSANPDDWKPELTTKFERPCKRRPCKLLRRE